MKLTLLEDFNVKNLIFESCQKKTPSDQITYYQSNIAIRYPDGSKGPLIMQLPRCFTYGVSQFDDKLSLSLILGEDRESMSTEHKHAVQVLNDLVAACKQFVLTEDVKNKIGEYDLEERDLKEMSFLKPQKDKDTKKPLLERPFMMNVKFMTKMNKETKGKDIISKLYTEGEFDENGNPVSADPTEFLNKQGTCVPLLKFESLFLGKKTKVVQVKVFECDMKLNDSGFKSLIRRVAPVIRTSTQPSAPAEDVDSPFEEEEETSEPVAKRLALMSTASDDENENGEQNEEDDDNDSVVSTPAPAPVVAPAPAPAAGPAKKVVGGRRK
jgi:hypothetical protein